MQKGNRTPDAMDDEVVTETVIGIDQDVSTVLHVMPNPASDVLNVSLMQTDAVKVSALIHCRYVRAAYVLPNNMIRAM
jgi:hypothetical protein